MKAGEGDAAQDPIPGRLRWLCRRGMLELDAWLQPFLERRYPELDAQARADFERLLDLEDFQLYDFLTRASQPPPDLRGIVDQLLSSRH